MGEGGWGRWDLREERGEDVQKGRNRRKRGRRIFMRNLG